MQSHLVIMVKAPVMGAVKSRLARDIGATPATWFYRHELARLAREMAGDRRWRTAFAVTPDTSLTAPIWPQPACGMAQGPGDLGSRMGRIIRAMPPGPVVIIGSDVPALRAAHVAAGFAALGDRDAVFGPSPDGGYYLVGLKRVPNIPNAFAHVRWSGPHALSDTLSNLGHLTVAMLEPLSDIDTGDDYARWRAGWG